MNATTNGSPRILIVSENLLDIEFLENVLRDEKCRIQSFCNVRVALKSMPAHQPDLILLNFSDSNSKGNEICRRLKTDRETQVIPVLMVMALNERADIENAVTAGCDDFLTGPVNEHELRTRVRVLLRVKRLVDEAKRLRDELSD